MTIHTLHPRLPVSKRPTVSTPVLKSDNLAVTLSSLDDHIRLLRCAADSVALDEEGAEQGELTETLYFLHGKLRRDIDSLFSLL